jgi:two-component system chemotaxis response regulator CheB
MTTNRRTRVLIVDDSAIVRKILAETLANEPDIEVVGVAPDAYVARQKILSLEPDVITLDIEMPRMDGLTFLKILMEHHPLPVLIISSLGHGEKAIEALRLGAVEVLPKPGGPYSVGDLRAQLAPRIRAAAQARIRPASRKTSSAPVPVDGAGRSTVIAIGASTGGTEAIAEVLMRLPEDSPGIVIVQHIPAVFSESFASRLDRTCAMKVREAKHMDECVAGVALVAPGNFHMTLVSRGDKKHVLLNSEPQVNYHRPSVDVLFQSVAKAAGADAIGVLLTGMGVDGARGLLEMRQKGASTIAQDESTSVVFGMPGEAIRLGAADRGTPISRIPAAIVRALQPEVARR